MSDERNRLYARFRRQGGSIVGERALQAWRNAGTVERFRSLECGELDTPGPRACVRLRAEPEEENYFDVFGEPDDKKDRAEMVRILETYGAWAVFVEVWDPVRERWDSVDSLGMNTGYRNPCDPFENDYVPGMMRAALDELDKRAADPSDSELLRELVGAARWVLDDAGDSGETRASDGVEYDSVASLREVTERAEKKLKGAR